MLNLVSAWNIVSAVVNTDTLFIVIVIITVIVL